MKWLPKVVGLVLVLAVVAGGWYWQSVSQKLESITAIETAKAPVTVALSVGSERMGLLRDPEFVRIAEEYNVTFKPEKVGSMEMCRTPAAGKDALWPSNQMAAGMCKAAGVRALASESIFGSPVVVYAYAEVAAALVKDGTASEESGIVYVDAAKLARALAEERTWADLGLPEFYGKARVVPTDPRLSSSGNMFAGLLASMLNGGEVPTDATVDEVVPGVQKYFARLGMLEEGSGTLFERFLNDKGGHPAVVGYENQLVEFNLENPKYQQLVRTSVRTLYPRPTTWAEFPLLALTENGKRAVEVLRDPRVQKLAWERHGFRSGLNAQNDPQALAVAGIPANVTSIIPMPSAPVMERITSSLASN